MARGGKLDGDAIAERLKGHADWSEQAGALHRQLTFPAFADAFAFMTRVALAADRLDHHPDWSNAYTKVTIDLSSHDVGGISERDFRLAAIIDDAARALGGE